MTADEDLRLPFLETRTYLHGTTLFDALASRMDEPGSISFTISRRIETDVVRLYGRTSTGAPRDNECAHLALRSDGGGKVIGVIPLKPSGHARRESYDETLVTERVKLTDGAVELFAPSPFGLVATLVPMFKRLLLPVAISGQGMWMFTRLDLARVPNVILPLRLTLDAVLAGKLARSTLSIQEEKMGELYFSWVSAEKR